MKKILLVLLAIFLTGCTAEYTVILDEKNLDETLDIYITEEEYISLSEEEITDFIIDFETDRDFYNKEEIKLSLEKLGYRYTYLNNYETFSIESYPALCYEQINITTENSIKITTSDYFLCFDYYPELEEITVNIKTKNKVINHNADTNEGLKYSWKINKDNYENKPINIELSYEKNDINSFQILLYLGLGLIILLVVYIVLKIRKNNKY